MNKQLLIQFHIMAVRSWELNSMDNMVDLVAVLLANVGWRSFVLARNRANMLRSTSTFH